jgi:hypothetical protein
MPKGMTKYQLEHFKSKVRRNFGPLIQEQELLVKQYRAEATEKIVGKLAKKMGADKILNEFRKAEAQLTKVRDKAEIRRRPEGKKLKQLEDLQRRSIDTVMEAGTPDELLRALDAETKKIGIAWVVPTHNIKQITN